MSHEINIIALSEAIIRHREQNNLTVRAAASQMENVSASTLSRVERGNLPDIDTYMRICRWLGVRSEHFAIRRFGGNIAERELSINKEDIIVHLRADKLLTQQTREALVTMIEVAYLAARRNLLPNEANQSSDSTSSGLPSPV